MATAVQGPLSLSTSTDAAAIRTIVEAASLAMVREFLAKRRYKKTLDMLSTELVSRPTTTQSTLRSALAAPTASRICSFEYGAYLLLTA